MINIIDITNNELLIELGFGLKTKKGEMWKTRNGYRIDWEKIVQNNIATFFGEFLLVKEERIDKDWYFVLEDDKCIYKIKRNQARKNKKMPKNVEIIEKQVETIDIQEIRHQLCLPPAREYIDMLMMNELGETELLPNEYFPMKIQKILSHWTQTKEYDEFKKLSRRLQMEYHPDRYRNENDKFAKIKFQTIREEIEKCLKEDYVKDEETGEYVNVWKRNMMKMFGHC